WASTRHGRSAVDNSLPTARLARKVLDMLISPEREAFSLAELPPGWPEEIVGGTRDVPVLDGTTRRPVNLDNAASTPPLVVVRDAVHRFAEWYASVHRGSGFKSQLSTHVLES